MIAFLTSRLGIAACAAGALLLVGIYAWGLRQENGKLELEKAAVEAHAESLQRDIDAAKDAAAKSGEIIRGLSASASAADAKVREYERDLESRPNGDCALTDADVGRLRDIGR
jgi:hypothetical protein